MPTALKRFRRPFCSALLLAEKNPSCLVWVSLGNHLANAAIVWWPSERDPCFFSSPHQHHGWQDAPGLEGRGPTNDAEHAGGCRGFTGCWKQPQTLLTRHMLSERHSADTKGQYVLFLVFSPFLQTVKKWYFHGSTRWQTWCCRTELAPKAHTAPSVPNSAFTLHAPPSQHIPLPGAAPRQAQQASQRQPTRPPPPGMFCTLTKMTAAKQLGSLQHASHHGSVPDTSVAAERCWWEGKHWINRCSRSQSSSMGASTFKNEQIILKKHLWAHYDSRHIHVLCRPLHQSFPSLI